MLLPLYATAFVSMSEYCEKLRISSFIKLQMRLRGFRLYQIVKYKDDSFHQIKEHQD